MTFRALPFKRGNTYADGEITMSLTTAKALEGRIYEVPDDVNGTGLTVKLRVVRNVTGSAITVARAFCQFKADDAGAQWGRHIGADGSGCTADLPSSAMDDAMIVDASIVENDLFYVVDEGPVQVVTGATAVDLNPHVGVACDGSGLVAAALAAAGKAIVGHIDVDTTDEGAVVLIHARPLVSQQSDPAT